MQLTWQWTQLRALASFATVCACALAISQVDPGRRVPWTAAVSGMAKLEALAGEAPPDARAILKRNIFDHSARAMTPDPMAASAASNAAPSCAGDARLVACAFDSRDHAWSFASIALGASSPLLYRVGGSAAGRRLKAIYAETVVLEARDGRQCSLSLFTPARPLAPPPLPAAPELDARITALGDGTYSVQRSLVDELLRDAGRAQGCHVVAHEEHGQVIGVKLYGIRARSVFAQLGLQNGDLLRSINGYTMTSASSGLEAYAALRSARQLSVALSRRGKPQNLEFRIVD